MKLLLGTPCFLLCAALFAQETKPSPPPQEAGPVQQPLAIKLFPVDPVVFPSADSAVFEFTLTGENLGPRPESNQIEIVGRGLQNRVDCEKLKQFKGGAVSGELRGFCLEVPAGMEGRQLIVRGLRPSRYDGAVRVRVRVGANASDPATPITFAAVSPRGAQLLALLLFGVLGLTIYLLARKGIAKIQQRTIAAFFLDPQTNSYSISKFQLLVWLSALVFGYIYLFVCRLLIQWNFQMPEIPSNFPELLAISAGTTVTAVGATVARGSKGAGPIGPSMADFVSTGGMVVAERFQFFVWTLVGAGAYLALLLRKNPATLETLPDVPSGMLYLMGISSAGYLAGKLVRKPGPVIRGIEVIPSAPADAAVPATKGEPKLTLRLLGDNLSSDAGFKIDGELLGPYRVSITGKKGQDGAPDSRFCSVLEVTVKDAEKYLEGEHTVAIINDDGQSAETRFPVDPIAISSVGPVTHGVAPVRVTGQNFAQGISAVWKDVSANITESEAKVVGPTEMELKMAPPNAGEFELILTTPAGLRAHQKVAAK